MAENWSIAVSEELVAAKEILNSVPFCLHIICHDYSELPSLHPYKHHNEICSNSNKFLMFRERLFKPHFALLAISAHIMAKLYRAKTLILTTLDKMIWVRAPANKYGKPNFTWAVQVLKTRLTIPKWPDSFLVLTKESLQAAWKMQQVRFCRKHHRHGSKWKDCTFCFKTDGCNHLKRLPRSCWANRQLYISGQLKKGRGVYKKFAPQIQKAVRRSSWSM